MSPAVYRSTPIKVTLVESINADDSAPKAFPRTQWDDLLYSVVLLAQGQVLDRVMWALRNASKAWSAASRQPDGLLEVDESCFKLAVGDKAVELYQHVRSIRRPKCEQYISVAHFLQDTDELISSVYHMAMRSLPPSHRFYRNPPSNLQAEAYIFLRGLMDRQWSLGDVQGYVAAPRSPFDPSFIEPYLGRHPPDLVGSDGGGFQGGGAGALYQHRKTPRCKASVAAADQQDQIQYLEHELHHTSI